MAKEDERPEYYRNRVNAGLHVINPTILDHSGIDADKVGTVGENGKPIRLTWIGSSLSRWPNRKMSATIVLNM